MLIASLLIFHIFFRPRWAFSPQLHDAHCYLEWLHEFLFQHYPECYSRAHLPGIAFLWIPAGILAKLFSWITQTSLYLWVTAFVGIQSFLAWVATLFLIDHLGAGFNKNSKYPFNSVFWSLCLLLCIPVITFATRQTIDTHANELFLSFLLVYFLFRKKILYSFLIAILLTLVRLNDFPVILVVLGFLIDQNREKLKITRKQLIAFSIISFIVLLPGFFYIYKVAFVTGYNGVNLLQAFSKFSLSHIFETLFTDGMGFFWMAPWWMFCFSLGLWKFKLLSWTARGGLLWMLAELILIILLYKIRWDYNSPTWRYAMGSHAAVFIIWWEVVPGFSDRAIRILKWFVSLCAVWLSYYFFLKEIPQVGALDFFQMILYPKALTPPIALTPLGFNLFSFLSDHPLIALKYPQYTQYAFKGTPLYILTAVNIISLTALFWLLLKKPRTLLTELFSAKHQEP